MIITIIKSIIIVNRPCASEDQCGVQTRRFYWPKTWTTSRAWLTTGSPSSFSGSTRVTRGWKLWAWRMAKGLFSLRTWKNQNHWPFTQRWGTLANLFCNEFVHLLMFVVNFLKLKLSPVLLNIIQKIFFKYLILFIIMWK